MSPEEMPTPGRQRRTGGRSSQKQPSGQMPVSSAAGSSSAGAMPTPGQQTSMGGSKMPTPVMQGGDPDGSASGQLDGSKMHPPSMQGFGADVPRFPPADQAPGDQAPATFEPGVVEVQFKEGMRPVVSRGAAGAPAVTSDNETRSSMDGVNRTLREHNLLSAEPTFDIAHDYATEAKTTAQAVGIDAPHLAHFVTLHFPPDADVVQIASQLSELSEVEVAAPVPRAIPPSVSAPPATSDEGTANGVAADVLAPPARPPVGPLTEPLVGVSDQLTVDPNTGLEFQWYVFRCHADTAWPRATGSNVVIADVDWGYRTSHQDLAANIDNVHNSYDGGNDVTQGGSVFHGTGVLGLTGAAANSLGMAGFAPSARLWGIQADSGPGPALGGNPWARGIDWVRTTDSGGRRKVVILEVQTGAFGNYEQVPSVNAAIQTAIGAGVVVCVAAGNGDRDAGLDDSGNPFPETGSILVGATEYDPNQNVRAWFSNYSPRVVVCAPGDGDHDVTCDSASDTAYRNDFGGTSGATPKVAGTVALMLSVNPGLTHAQILTMLSQSGGAVVTDPAKPVGTFLDADAALGRAQAGLLGRLEIFARGADAALWHNWQTAPNNGWSGWHSLGGWIDLLEVASNADGRLEIFARGADAALWHNWQTAPNNGWSGWHSLGGWIDLLEVASNADGRLEIFARGADGALWHNWQTAPNNGWSGWHSLGGWIDLLAVGNNAA
jgi:subtilisin family serine protease